MLPSVIRNTDGPGLKPPIESVARIKNTAAAFPGKEIGTELKYSLNA